MAKTTAVTFGTAGIDAQTLSDEAALRGLVRSALVIACEQGLEPDLAAPHPRDRRSLMTHLTDAQGKYLMGLMARQGAKVPVASAVGRLVDAALPAAMAKIAAVAPDDVLAEVLDSLKLGHRDEQRALYRHICASLDASATGIVAAQASTGIGKTTVAHAVAADWAQGRLGAKALSVVVVSFPSLHGVKAFASQWLASRDAGMDLPAAQVLMGRREFVSRNALLELLHDPQESAPHLPAASIEAIDAWVKEQDAAGARSSWWMDHLLERVAALVQRHGRVDEVQRLQRVLGALRAAGAISAAKADKPIHAVLASTEGAVASVVQPTAALQSPTYYSANTSWIIQRNGYAAAQANDEALAVSLVGTNGNYAHANGLAMELYATDMSLAPESGRGSGYFQSDYADYYSQLVSHNTVVVDGISTYPAMKVEQPFQLLAAYPAPGTPLASADPNITMAEVSFVEPAGQADQRRLMATVRTDERQAYVVDVLRSRRRAGGDRYHDYILHGFGQRMSFQQAGQPCARCTGTRRPYSGCQG